MNLLEIYADDEGESHFRETDIALQEADFAPPSQPVMVSAESTTTTSLFLEADPGWDDAYHVTPRRQLAVILVGSLKITCSDGDSRTVAPGGVVLLNDLVGKGHRSHVQGSESVRVLLVGLDN